MKPCACRDVAEVELEQVRLIEAYLSALWCPARAPSPTLHVDERPIRPGWARLDSCAWVYRLNLPYLRTLSYPQVLDAIRAA